MNSTAHANETRIEDQMFNLLPEVAVAIKQNNEQSKSNFQNLQQSISRLEAHTADMRAKVELIHGVSFGRLPVRLFPVTDAGLNTTESEMDAVTVQTSSTSSMHPSESQFQIHAQTNSDDNVIPVYKINRKLSTVR
jgi:hypothetical protein